MSHPRILILTLSFGTGHVVASAAIAEAIRSKDDGAEVRVIDCLQESTPWFRALYAWPYWMMIRYAPFLWNRLFRARQEKHHQQTAPRWLFRWGCRRVFREIRTWNPDILVATEVGACEMASLAKQKKWTGSVLVAVATDHESEPVWVKAEVDRYFVPTTAVATQLSQWKIDPRRITVSGIPLLRRFQLRRETGSLEKEKEALGLPVDRPMILVMGGGMGPLKMDEIVRGLATLEQPVSLVTVAGLNSKMQRRLEALRREVPLDKPLTVFGWTDHVDQLMRAADLLVTKPGGMTLTEAVCLGLPMVCVNPIPGPEEVHCRLIEREGLGRVARSTEDVIRVVRHFLSVGTPERNNPPAWLKPDAADQIAGWILNERPLPDPNLDLPAPGVLRHRSMEDSPTEAVKL